MLKEMQLEHRNEFIDLVCKGPDSPVDEKIRPRLEALKNRTAAEIKDELLGIIDECKYHSLASKFTINALYVFWRMVGGTEEEFTNREEVTKENFQRLKDKYKWKMSDHLWE